jgi:hypothetical protein
MALLSPRARLYSIVPRSSQFPSILMFMSGWELRNDALALRLLMSSGVRMNLSKAHLPGSVALNV